MKSLNLLSIVIILGVSAQALAQVPPPLKPVEYLEPDDLKTTPSQPAKPTTPPVVAPQPVKPPVVVTQPPKPTAPPVVQPTKPTTPPVVRPTKPTTPPVVTQPAKPTAPPAKPPVVVTRPSKPVVTQPVKPSRIGAFNIGDEVATDRHEIGYIVDFPSSQSALVRFPRGTYEWPVNRLSFMLNTSRGFRVGQVVINDRHERGVIELIFADETANVRFASGAYNWPLSRLGHEIASLDGFSVGMSVVTDRHDSGIIVEVFNDRTANVRFRGGETYNWPLSRLGREVTTLDGFQIGQSVATDRRDTGVIEQIFADHTANVRFRGGEVFNWPLNRLGPAFYSPRTTR